MRKESVTSTGSCASMSTSPPPTLPSFCLDGRVALVTGGTRGLGWQIAKAFAAAGAAVVVSSRHDDACQAAAAELRETGGEAHAIPCHVGRWAELDHLAEASEGWKGGVDVLVN